MDFPFDCRTSPPGRFRLKSRRSVAASDTRLPLSPHCNPLSALRGKVSLGVFHNITHRFYPLLQAWFQEAISPSAAATAGNASLLYPRMSTQGRLRCTQHTILCTALQVLLLFRTQSGLRYNATGRLSHNSRSPRKSGRSVYAITPRPITLTPSTHPNLGEKSKHQGLHRYAL